LNSARRQPVQDLTGSGKESELARVLGHPPAHTAHDSRELPKRQPQLAQQSTSVKILKAVVFAWLDPPEPVLLGEFIKDTAHPRQCVCERPVGIENG